MVVFVSDNQRMTSHYAPVHVTAHICKSIGSMNQKIHHTRLQLLVKMYCGLLIYQKMYWRKQRIFEEIPGYIICNLCCP